MEAERDAGQDADLGVGGYLELPVLKVAMTRVFSVSDMSLTGAAGSVARAGRTCGCPLPDPAGALFTEQLGDLLAELVVLAAE